MIAGSADFLGLNMYTSDVGNTVKLKKRACKKRARKKPVHKKSARILLAFIVLVIDE